MSSEMYNHDSLKYFSVSIFLEITSMHSEAGIAIKTEKIWKMYFEALMLWNNQLVTRYDFGKKNKWAYSKYS